MHVKLKIQNIIIETVSMLYILLFIYAAVSKLLDFENFQVQVGQSPLLSAYAEYVAHAVVICEIGISVILAIPRLRIAGLYLSTALMAMFTTYIFIILNFSSFIPCSCGGILEKMGWTAHLVFNAAFVCLGIIAVLLFRLERARMTLLIITLVAAPGFITVLYISSEKMMREENPFIRRFQMFALSERKGVDLKNSAFYFAGYDDRHIYLGNHSAPLHIIAYDPQLKEKKHYKIELENDKFPFRSVEIRTAGAHFYLYDGLVPVLYRGTIGNWKAKVVYNGNHYFTKGVAIDSVQFAIRGQTAAAGEHLLGKMKLRDTASITYSPSLLQKQIDGVFDTDGTLSYSPELKRLVYTYYYRNEFIVCDQNLALLYRGNTIDTTKKAKLKVVRLEKSGDTKLAEPPNMVNKATTVYSNLLFVNSSLKGRFEESEVWKHAAIIDVYDILHNQYKFSFYLYGDSKSKPGKFIANKFGIYSIVNHTLYYYQYGSSFNESFTGNTK